MVLLACLFGTVKAQKVGLVLSGGGANGYAHIGVIQALEEHNIPIDYITGTSSGALVGALYASGYTINEIKELLLSDEFVAMTQGEKSPEEEYFFRKEEPSASMLTLRLAKGFSLSNSLPTNVISTNKVDLVMMRLFSQASAAARYDFDSLMIPMRCVAADIDNKEEFVFAFGNLSTAVRASFTYPFVIKPIEVDGKVLFDGGLYNNFPHDIMTKDFNPDYIIGVKVTSNEPPAKGDDLISQVRAMMISKTDFNLKSPGIILEPNSNQGAFDFFNLEALIDSGYQQTLRNIETIKKSISHPLSSEKLANKRKEFKSKFKPLVYDKVYTSGVTERQKRYVNKSLDKSKKDSTFTIDELENNLYKTTASEHIKSIYPSSAYNSETGKYSLHTKVQKQRPFVVDFGGNIASRPITTGYIGVKYIPFSNPSYTLKFNSYFGRFYSSVLGSAKIDFSFKVPFALEFGVINNSWNYFTSQSFFFEDEKPAYLVKQERMGFAELSIPFLRNGKLTAGGQYIRLTDNYYQTQSFNSKDKPDETRTIPRVGYLKYEYNTQNRIIYPSSGTRVQLKGFYAKGTEETTPGSTSQDKNKFFKTHEWNRIQFSANTFYKNKGALRFGVSADAVWSNQKLFNNYTASILQSPSYEPIPESKTLFLESFRAYKYLAAGHQFVYNVWGDIDLRAEGYVFAPYEKVVKLEDGSQKMETGFKTYYSMISSAAVYNSPVGPISFSLNYYYNAPEVNPNNQQLSFLFHFGYIIFNKRHLN